MAFISIGNLIGGGAVPDHPDYDLPPNVFTEAENVEFTVNGVRPALREVGILDPMQDNPLFLDRAKFGAGLVGWVYFSKTDGYVIYNDQHTKITRVVADGGQYSTDENRRWNSAILHGVPIYNNSYNAPQELDPANPFAPLRNLTNWPSTLRAKVLRPYKNFLIAIAVQPDATGPYDEQSVIWSSPADPGSVPPSWDYTDPAQLAGLFTFSETDDRLVDGLTLGDEFIVYKENSIYSMRYIGGTFVMSIKRRPFDIGLMAKGCVTDFPGGHFFVGQDDIYVFDGVSIPRSIGDARVRRNFIASISPEQREKIFVEHDAATKSCWVFYPTDGALWCTRAAVWNYVTGTWTFRTVPHISDTALGRVGNLVQRSWDDLLDIWGGLSGTPSDESPWNADTTSWDTDSSWENETDSVWDVAEFVPLVDNLVMATYINEEAVYDEARNVSTANGVEWTGNTPYPPLWLIPTTGRRYPGRLLKQGIAIAGRDHNGNLEVNRTFTKILSEFYPEMDYGKLKIRFGTQSHPRADIEWTAEYEFDSAEDIKVDPLIAGKYLAFEIVGGGDGDQDWLLSGYGMEINRGGRY